jgi:hypothetical protein
MKDGNVPTYTIGQSPFEVEPQFGRVFKHLPNRRSVRYSDGANAPFTRGTIVPSGTPTNRVPAQLKAIITKTGKATETSKTSVEKVLSNKNELLDALPDKVKSLAEANNYDKQNNIFSSIITGTGM